MAESHFVETSIAVRSEARDVGVPGNLRDLAVTSLGT
jgi:hypothetical protein